MNRISLAVCIVFYNKALLTRRCIASVVKANIPVYVLDNGSEPESATSVRNFCNSFQNVTFLQSLENLGPAGGRNLLIKSTNQEWLLFLDNDVTVETPDWAERLQAHIAANSDLEAISLSIINSWDKSLVRPARLEVIDGAARFMTVYDGKSNLYPGGGTAVSRRMFDRLGQYDAKLWAFEEAELCLRAIQRGSPVKVRMVEDIKLLHHHEFLDSEADRNAVRERYDTGRIGLAQQEIERRYQIDFERKYSRWVRSQARDHLIAPWVRRIERGVWGLISRVKRVLLGRQP